MATTAAVVAAGATVAAAGVSAAGAGGGKGGGGGAPTMEGMSQWERIFNRGTADMNDEERRVMEDALAQQNFMQPEMYKLLGYEPIYDDRGVTPDSLKALGAQTDAATRVARGVQETIDGNKSEITTLTRTLKTTKGKKAKKEVRQQIAELRKESKQAKQDRNPLMRQAEDLQRQFSDAQTMPRRVVGVKKLDHPADPTSSGGDLYRMAFDLQNESLVRALKGEEPVDATLKNQWDMKERDLRESLRRSMGEDYMNSTGGAQALSQFDTARNAAFTNFNRQLVGELSGETQARAESLSNLTSARMQQLLYPARSQQEASMALGQAAQSRLGIAGLFQHERTAQYEGKNNAYAQDQANAAARSQAMASLLNSAGQGIGAAGPTAGSALGGYTGSPAAQPTTVTVPTY